MPEQKEKRYWINERIKHIENNWDKYKNRIQFTFTIALFILPFAVSYAIQTESDVLYIVASISFWAVIICGGLLIRNTGKTTKLRLDIIDNKLSGVETHLVGIETQLKKSNKKLDKLIRILSKNEVG